MSRFAPIPAPPVFGAQDWEVRTLNAMKQNVDLLAGQRNEADLASKAVLTSAYNLPFTGDRRLDRVNNINYDVGTSGTFVSDSSGGGTSQALVDSINNGVLASDLDIIRQDIAALRSTINSILAAFR